MTWTQAGTLTQAREEARAHGYDERPITWREDEGRKRRPGCTCGCKGEAASLNHQFAQDAASHHAQQEHGYPSTFHWPDVHS